MTQKKVTFMDLFTIGITGGAVLLAIILSVVIFKACYKTCPPNRAMVITGPRGTSTVIGRARFIIPFFHRVDYMSLENIQVDFTSKDEIPTRDAINIFVDVVANMSIDQDPTILKTASSKFLGWTIEDIKREVQPILEGNIREIISQTDLKTLIQGDKKIFSEQVVENVTPNLRDMGLKLTTFNIQNFKAKSQGEDENGKPLPSVIENLGIENIEQIRKDALIASAKARAEVAKAEAENDKIANDARVLADTEIARRETELRIEKARLQKEADVKTAEAEAAKGIESENQRKTLEIVSAEADLARQEQEIKLKEREVAIKERALEAEIKKQAEADKYAAQQRADAELYAKQKAADAELFARQQKAEADKFEAEKKADAQKALADAVKVQGIAEAEAIKAKGQAEADAVQAKLEAEARGLREKAEAMKEYGDAARQQMELDTLKVYFEQLPAIAKAIGDGYQNVDSIYMYGGETSKLAGDIMTNVSQISEGLSKSMGLDMKTILAGMLGGKLAGNNDPSVVVVTDGKTKETKVVHETVAEPKVSARKINKDNSNQ